MASEDKTLEQIVEGLGPVIGRGREDFIALGVAARREDVRHRHQTRAELVERRRAVARNGLASSIPNALGTVMGGLALGLLAWLGGLLSDLPAWVVAVSVIAVASYVAGLTLMLFRASPARDVDEDAVRQEYADLWDMLVDAGVIKPSGPAPDDELG